MKKIPALSNVLSAEALATIKDAVDKITGSDREFMEVAIQRNEYRSRLHPFVVSAISNAVDTKGMTPQEIALLAVSIAVNTLELLDKVIPPNDSRLEELK